MKIYVASSWRNPRQQTVVEKLRADGHEVYDFRNPRPGDHGFNWREVNPAASTDDGFARREWGAQELITALAHPVAERGFTFDRDAMQWADACVLVLPCGRSAHLELGWLAGKGKRTAILLSDAQEPELMYKLVDHISPDLADLRLFLREERRLGNDPNVDAAIREEIAKYGRVR